MEEFQRQNVFCLRGSNPFIAVDLPRFIEVMSASSSGEKHKPSSAISIHITLYIQSPSLELKSIDSCLVRIFTGMDDGIRPQLRTQEH